VHNILAKLHNGNFHSESRVTAPLRTRHPSRVGDTIGCSLVTTLEVGVKHEAPTVSWIF